jgi:hypothetical protein
MARMAFSHCVFFSFLDDMAGNMCRPYRARQLLGALRAEVAHDSAGASAGKEREGEREPGAAVGGAAGGGGGGCEGLAAGAYTRPLLSST